MTKSKSNKKKSCKKSKCGSKNKKSWKSRDDHNEEQDKLTPMEEWDEKKHEEDPRFREMLEEVSGKISEIAFRVLYGGKKDLMIVQHFLLKSLDEEEYEDRRIQKLGPSPSTDGQPISPSGICTELPANNQPTIQSLEPSEEAILTKITVHFRKVLDDDENGQDHTDSDYDESSQPAYGCRKKKLPCIVGFTMTYSDGVETEVGSLKGSTSQDTLDLTFQGVTDPITRIEQRISDLHSRPSRIDFLMIDVDGFDITCANGIVTDEPEEKGIFDSIEYLRRNEENSFQVPRGHMLRSIQWSSEHNKIVGIRTQPRQINDGSNLLTESPHPESEACAPGKMTKSNDQMEGLLGSNSKYSDFNDRAFEQIQKICESAQCDLLKEYYEMKRKYFGNSECFRYEYGIYRFYLEDSDETSLRSKVEHLIRQEEKNLNTNIVFQELKKECYAFLVDELCERNTKKDRQYAEHKILVSTGKAKTSSRVCRNYKCSKSYFDPKLVRSSKRCCVDNCFDQTPNCGCSIKPCSRCHISFCRNHARIHEEECRKSFAFRCGSGSKARGPWDKSLKIELCGQLVHDKETLKKCVGCSVMVCGQCSITCSGRPSQSVAQYYGINFLQKWVGPRFKSLSCSGAWCITCQDDKPHMNSHVCDDCYEVESNDYYSSDDSSYSPHDSNDEDDRSFDDEGIME